jgi:hypothetical protein
MIISLKRQVVFMSKNNRMATRTVMCIILLVLLLFLCSCGSNNRQAINYHSGTRGIEINFLNQAPPSEIYENSSFTATLLVENRGAFDVMNPDYGILSLSFDPFYLSTSDLSGVQNIVLTKNGFTFKGVQMPGKSEYFPTGYQAFISFPYFQAKSILGEREKPSTQLFATLCYPYKTLYSGTACLDFNIYGDNARKQVCSEQDIILQDQGAPLAITLIETENQPVGQGVRPVFTVHVLNKGSGSVLTNYDNAPDLDRVCTLQDLYKEDFNMVGIKATLSTNKELICNPNPIKLFNGEGITRCVVQDKDLVLGNTNYEALLSIELNYVYLTSISKNLEIKRLNPYGGPAGAPTQCLPTEVAEGDKCITRCDYCAKYGGGGGDCSVPTDSLHPNLRISFQVGFACQCTYADCINLYPDGLCIPTANFCPGASYCCMPACKATEVRINGTCYPKCSSGLTCTALTTKQCACGTGTDPNAYRLISRDLYCCPLYSSSYSDSASCKSACVKTTTTSSTSSTTTS